jgi:syntaxin 5
MCDRTQEFLQFVERSGTSIGPGPNGSTVSNPLNSTAVRTVEAPKARTKFYGEASDIARGIHKASGQLATLAKKVKQQGLFDDSTEEINALIFRIKGDLDELNTKCDSAQQLVDSQKRSSSSSSASKDQVTEYNSTVINTLKTNLMTTTKDFKNVLEVRSSKMKDQQQRKKVLTGDSNLSPMKTIKPLDRPAMTASPYAKLNFDNASANGIYGNSNSSSSSSSISNNSSSAVTNYQQQQLLFVPQANEQYLESRHEAATEVEKTIGELGTLFKRLATMIADQQTLVERIDEDVETAVSNSEQAHNMLQQAYAKASSNWGLFLKLAGLFGVFALFFIIFLL